MERFRVSDNFFEKINYAIQMFHYKRRGLVTTISIRLTGTNTIDDVLFLKTWEDRSSIKIRPRLWLGRWFVK